MFLLYNDFCRSARGIIKHTLSVFSLWGFFCFSFEQDEGISSATGKSPFTEQRTMLSCKSKGPDTFNNRRGCCVEGLAARAQKPLSAQPATASTVTDTEPLNWKHKDMKGGRGIERFRGEEGKE